MSDSGEPSSVPHPPFLLAGIRTALEMSLVAITIGLIGLPAENPLYLSVIALLAVVAMLVIYLSTLGLYALFVIFGVGLNALGVPGRLVDWVRDRRS